MIKVYDKIVYKPIDTLIPYENNARNNEEAIKALVKEIPVVGFNVPIVIDKNNVIVKGHSRLEALKQLGVDLVPCIVVEGSEQEIAEERLVDNRLSELAEWDEDRLKYEIREMTIDLGSFGITLPAFKSEVQLVRDVQKADVQAAERKLIGDGHKTVAERKNLVELTCPNCGNTFYSELEAMTRHAY